MTEDEEKKSPCQCAPIEHNDPMLCSGVFLVATSRTAVVAQDRSIPIVVSANKWNQLGSWKFSVMLHPAKQANGPNSNGIQSIGWTFLSIHNERSIVIVTNNMKTGMMLLSPLNASGMGLPIAFCFK
jgi:hypothetical protein